MRRHEQTGRPPGSGSFVENLENMPGRILKPKKGRQKTKGQAEISMDVRGIQNL